MEASQHCFKQLDLALPQRAGRAGRRRQKTIFASADCPANPCGVIVRPKIRALSYSCCANGGGRRRSSEGNG